MKLAVVLFNLGGPDSLDAVEPFLVNLFSDPAVINLPGIVRKPLARMIARRRAPIAREIYAKIGGRSPIVAETEAQARALERALSARGHEARAFISMRCWKPFSDEAARDVAAWRPEHIVLLPLYPQYSTTTTASAIDDWRRAASVARLAAPTTRVCCFPWEPGFVTAQAKLIQETFTRRKPSVDYRLLLSAHGLPERTVAKGDPYQWQVEQTAAALVRELGIEGLDWRVCYQSRVGPLKWIGPATDEEVRRAAQDGKGVVLAPIAFVSEHSETLVELDMEYAHLAETCGAADYLRVPTVGSQDAFVSGLARLVEKAAIAGVTATCGEGRICPTQWARCGYGEGRS